MKSTSVKAGMAATRIVKRAVSRAMVRHAASILGRSGNDADHPIAFRVDVEFASRTQSVGIVGRLDFERYKIPG